MFFGDRPAFGRKLRSMPVILSSKSLADCFGLSATPGSRSRAKSRCVLLASCDRTSIGVWRVSSTGRDNGNNLYRSEKSSGAGCLAKSHRKWRQESELGAFAPWLRQYHVYKDKKSIIKCLTPFWLLPPPSEISSFAHRAHHLHRDTCSSCRFFRLIYVGFTF